MSTSTNLDKFKHSFSIKNHTDYKKPLKILTKILTVPSRMQNYHMKKAELITGIADFVQIYITHTVNPISRLIVFHVKVINITNFVIKRLKINIALSENVETLPTATNEITITSLSTKEVFKHSVVTSLKQFDDCTCIVFAELDPDESCPSDDLISIKSLPYNVSLIDLIMPDVSASYCDFKFRVISNTIKFSFSKH